jgi:hypothetical protein
VLVVRQAQTQTAEPEGWRSATWNRLDPPVSQVQAAKRRQALQGISLDVRTAVGPKEVPNSLWPFRARRNPGLQQSALIQFARWKGPGERKPQRLARSHNASMATRLAAWLHPRVTVHSIA